MFACLPIGLTIMAIGMLQVSTEYVDIYKENTGYDEYTNKWVVEVPNGEHVAQRVAREHGFSFGGQAYSFKDHYLITRDDQPYESRIHSEHLTDRLLENKEVKWAEQQKIVTINFAGVVPPSNDENKHFGSTQQNMLGKLSTRPTKIHLRPDEVNTKNIGLTSNKTSAYQEAFNDKLWTKQWNFQDYRTQDYPVMDHNIVPVYRMGYTGSGVTVGVVDTGVQEDHPDLMDNYIKEYGYNFVYNLTSGAAGNWGQSPRAINNPDFARKITIHGTNSAGVIAMVANNSICGVGIAFNAKVASLVTGDRSTDAQYGGALQHRVGDIDIYSNSWSNPDYDGTVIHYPQELINKAIDEGVAKGRGGLGAVYVFISGNNRHVDNCATDSLSSNFNVILVAAANQYGKKAYYSESCAAIFATAYSGGTPGVDEDISTIQTESECYDSYTGNSAAGAAASGIIALLLEANPKLGYRDVQHIITMSAEVAPLADNTGTWFKNGAGFWVSNDFGFGLLNAENMVRLALNWTNVPKKPSTCTITKKFPKKVHFDFQDTISTNIKTASFCKHMVFLEHLELSFTIEHVYRGAISIELISPKDTKTIIMQPRIKDTSDEGYSNFGVSSTRTWGEDPRGIWIVKVTNSLPSTESGTGKMRQILLKLFRTCTAGNLHMGYIKDVTLKLRGLSKDPPHKTSLPREYAGFRLKYVSWAGGI